MKPSQWLNFGDGFVFMQFCKFASQNALWQHHVRAIMCICDVCLLSNLNLRVTEEPVFYWSISFSRSWRYFGVSENLYVIYVSWRCVLHRSTAKFTKASHRASLIKVWTHSCIRFFELLTNSDTTWPDEWVCESAPGSSRPGPDFGLLSHVFGSR